MPKAIKIRLVPNKNTKLYKPQPDYADLYVLMNKLHIQSVNEVDDEENQQVSELEMETHKTREEINKNYTEESTWNILQDCLENAEKNIKKRYFNNNKDFKEDPIEDFNKILDSLDYKTQNRLIKLNINNTDSLLVEVQNNLNTIKTEKTRLNNNTKDLSDKINKLETQKENMNSSITDIDTLEVAFKSIKGF